MCEYLFDLDKTDLISSTFLFQKISGLQLIFFLRQQDTSTAQFNKYYHSCPLKSGLLHRTGNLKCLIAFYQVLQ